MTSLCKYVVILLSLTISDVTPAFLKLDKEQVPATNSTQDFLERTLHGLERILRFFLREYKDVNLDAVIGTRIVEASLEVLQQQLDAAGATDRIPRNTRLKIQQLRDMGKEFSDMATPYVIASDPDYYESIGPTTAEDLFKLNYKSRDVSGGVILWPKTSEESMDESDSDNCLQEIFGTRTGIQCSISDVCWTRMTKFGYSLYSLSHEIFFLEIAEGFGCREAIEEKIIKHGQNSLKDLQEILCANMLDEANQIAEKGFPAARQDLFMEQATLCGILGFREFFNNDWLIKILSWQDPEAGCYKWEDWHPERKAPSHHRRSKREERRVYGGCLCHRSTVAAGALAQYVRYIVEMYLQENSQ